MIHSTPPYNNNKTLFLQIFNHMAFIEQKGKDNKKINVESMLAFTILWSLSPD